MADANMKYVLEVSAVAGVGGTQAIDQQTAAIDRSAAAQKKAHEEAARLRRDDAERFEQEKREREQKRNAFLNDIAEKQAAREAEDQKTQTAVKGAEAIAAAVAKLLQLRQKEAEERQRKLDIYAAEERQRAMELRDHKKIADNIAEQIRLRKEAREARESSLEDSFMRLGKIGDEISGQRTKDGRDQIRQQSRNDASSAKETESLNRDAAARLKELSGEATETGKSAGFLNTTIQVLASGGLSTIIAKLGAIGGVLFGVKQGFDAMLRTNPELDKSFQDLASTISNVFGGALNEALNSKGELTDFFNSITEGIGGVSEKMKRALGPFEDFVHLSEKALSPTEALTKALKDQSDAAKQLADEVDTLRKARDADLESARAAEDDQAAKDRRAVEQDGNLDPDARKQRLAELDALDRQRKLDRRRDDNDTKRADALADQELAKQDLAAKQKLVEDADAKSKASRRLSDAKTTSSELEERNKQATQDWLNAPKGSKERARLEKIADDTRMQAAGARNELAAAQSNAREVIGNGPSDPRELEAALKQAKAARDEAAAALRAASQKLARNFIEREQESAKIDAAQADELDKLAEEDKQRQTGIGQNGKPVDENSSGVTSSSTSAPAPAPAEPSRAASQAEPAEPSRERRASPVKQTDLDPNVMGYDENGPVYANSPGPDADNKGSGGVDWDYVAELRQRIADGEELSDDEQAYLDAAFEYYQQRIDDEKQQRKHKRRSSSARPSHRGRMHGGGGARHSGGESLSGGNVSSGAVFSGSNRPGADGRMGAVSPSSIFTGKDPRVKTTMVGTSLDEEGATTGAFSPSAAAPWMQTMADNHATLADSMTRVIRSMTEHTRAVTNAATPMHEAVRDSVLKHQDLGQRMAMVGTKLRETRLDERL